MLIAARPRYACLKPKPIMYNQVVQPLDRQGAFPIRFFSGPLGMFRGSFFDYEKTIVFGEVRIITDTITLHVIG